MHQYVAETNEQNGIEAVWVVPQTARNAHVFDPKRDRFEPNEDNCFSGASQAAIVNWLIGAGRT